MSGLICQICKRHHNSLRLYQVKFGALDSSKHVAYTTRLCPACRAEIVPFCRFAEMRALAAKNLDSGHTLIAVHEVEGGEPK